MAEELLQVKLKQELAKRIVARYCEYDSEIPLERRLCLLADEFKVPERKVHCVLVLSIGKDYAVEPYKEYVYW